METVDILRGLGGLTAAVVTVFTATNLVGRFFQALNLPLFGIRAESEEAEGTAPVAPHSARPLWGHVFRLFCTYWIVTLVFALTGGSISKLSGDLATMTSVLAVSAPVNTSPPDDREVSGNPSPARDVRRALVSGRDDDIGYRPTPTSVLASLFVGVLVVSVVRVASVTRSPYLIGYLITLSAVAPGVLAGCLAVDPPVLSRYSDALFDAFPDMPFWALVASCSACLVTETLVSVLPRWQTRARRVPYSLVRERLQAHEPIEQIFWAPDVRKRTRDLISEVITKDGLKDICWLTHTAPVDHLREITKATREWIKDRRVSANSREVELYLKALLGSRVRIIVTEHQADKVRRAGPWQVKSVPRPVRTRILLLNYRAAVMHLPLPFAATADEEANFAAIIYSPERRSELRSHFEALWHSLGIDSYIDAACGPLRHDSDLLGAVLWGAYRTRGPLSERNLRAFCRQVLGASFTDADFLYVLEELLARHILVRALDDQIRRNPRLSHELEDLHTLSQEHGPF